MSERSESNGGAYRILCAPPLSQLSSLKTRLVTVPEITKLRHICVPVCVPPAR
jgi:hypothetical protein